MGLNFEKADFVLAKKKSYIKKKVAHKFYKKIVNATGIKKTFDYIFPDDIPDRKISLRTHNFKYC